MQFSFRQQSGPTTTTNIEHQPSDLSKKNVTAVNVTVTTSASTLPITIVKSSSTSSAQLPTKTLSFDDKEEKFDGNKSASSSADSAINVDCCKQQSHTNLINTKTIINEKSNNNSVVLSNVSDSNLVVCSVIDSKLQKEQISIDSVVPLITFSETPTINVVCAPVVDDENSVTVQIHADHDGCKSSEITDAQSMDMQIDVEPTTTTTNEPDTSITSMMEEANIGMQLTLDVNRCGDDEIISTEELSPSMDEYQECVPSSDYQYDSVTGGEILAPGCVAPAPTPAPLIAPLAEDEFYPPDDDIPITIGDEPIECGGAVSSSTESMNKQTRKKLKKVRSTNEKDEKHDSTTKSTEEINRNAVCPWEDE